MDLGFKLLNKLRGLPDENPVPPVTPAVSMTPNQRAEEARGLALLEPSTREFTKSILVWARSQGIPALLGETYRSLEDQAKVPSERTGITPGKISWHQVGRAFHLIIRDPGGQLDKDAYRRVGDEVDRRGGLWLGRSPITTNSGKKVIDLAHYEYHPGLELWQYRKSPLAARELSEAAKRASRYG